MLGSNAVGQPTSALKGNIPIIFPVILDLQNGIHVKQTIPLGHMIFKTFHFLSVLFFVLFNAGQYHRAFKKQKVRATNIVKKNIVFFGTILLRDFGNSQLYCIYSNACKT